MTISPLLKLPCLTLFALGAVLQSRATAQVIPDGTLGVESSQLIDESAVEQLIRGGALRDENLFHSFEQFSIGEGNLVYFANPADVTRIFSRVTGTLPSDIFGTLGVDGGADLYLLNPNGILFGPNARLDVNGSFVASTADAFEFASLGTYSARSPEAPSPLLTVLPSALQFGQVLPGSITVQSTVDGGGFRVPNGESLVLLGGEVTVDGGELSAYGGRVEIGAATGSSGVGLAPDGRLVFAEGAARGDVSFEDGALVSVRLADGGDIGVTARNIDVVGSTLFAGIRLESSTAASQAGNLVLDATERIRLDDGFLRNDVASRSSGGNGGDVVIITPVLEVLNGGAVGAGTFGQGNAGRVEVEATGEVVVDGKNSLITSQVDADARGNSGGVSINTGNLSVLNDAEVRADTFGVGNAGQVEIAASGDVTVDGNGSLISSRARSDATGDSGGVSITTGNLSVLNDAVVTAATFGEGNAGQVVVEATGNVVVDGDHSFITSQVDADATGDSGGVSITTGNLSVRNAASVTASTFGEGNAGQVVVEATGEVTVDGDGSLITSQVDADTTGNSGGVSINAGNLSVLNDAEVRADTFGVGNAGQVEIAASGDVTVDGNGSLISSRARSDATGDSGGVSITTGNLSVLNDASVTASTFGEGNAGQVVVEATGNVVVDGDRSLIVSVVSSDATGDSGGISITTGNLSVGDGAVVGAGTFGQGNAGQVEVMASGDVTVDGDGSLIDSQVEEDATGISGGVFITTGNLSVLNDAEVRADTFGVGNAGQVEIAAGGDVTVDGDDSFISSRVRSDAEGNSGGVSIKTGNLSVLNNAAVSAGTFSTGNAGQVTVEATGDVLVDGDNSFISSQVNPDAEGDSGGVSITTGSLSVLNAAAVSANTFGGGNAGKVEVVADENILIIGEESLIVSSVRGNATGDSEGISIATNNLLVRDGAVVGAGTFGGGNAGRVAVVANGDVTVDGDGSLIDSQAGSRATGNSGGVFINTGNLSVLNDAEVRADTSGVGNAGKVGVMATGQVTVDGDDSFISSRVRPGAEGDSGGVSINTNNLSVRNAAEVTASTFSEGDAGQVMVVATGDVLVDGDRSFISSQVGSSATGNSGGVSINTGNLSILNGAVVDTGTGGVGNAGRVEVVASGDVTIDGDGTFISSQVRPGATGNSGGVSINTGNLSVLNDAVVTASTFSEGDAGQVVIKAAGNVVVDGDNSFITSQVNENATGNSGGVSINTGNLSVLNDAEARADTFGVGNAGRVEVVATGDVVVDGDDSSISSRVRSGAAGDSGGVSINTGNLSVLNDAVVTASTFGEGNAGQVEVVASGDVTIDGDGTFISSQVGSSATGGSGGVSINTGNLSVLNNAQVSAGTFGEGNAGRIKVVADENIFVVGEDSAIASSVSGNATGNSDGISITTDNLLVRDGAVVGAGTFGGGNAGRVDVVASGDITVDGDGSLIDSQVGSRATGNSGGVFISTMGLSMLNDARVNASTRGQGNAGLMEVLASNIALSTPGSKISAETESSGQGGGIRLLSPNSLTISGPGRIVVETLATGPAGNIEVVSEQLRLMGGVTLSASTAGEQPAGNITLNIADTLDIDSSTVTSSTQENSTGPGGSITVDAPVTRLRNNSEIAVNSDGTGQGGQVAITGNQLALINNSTINATTRSSDGGNLTFDLQEALALQGSSEISTEAGTDQAGGNGGDITITTQFIATDPRENSDIVANAFDGNGGNVNITATGGIFGIAPRPERTPQSDITASSRNGVSGSIAIESPDVDPNQSATELPTALDAPDVVQSCREAYVQSGSEFVVTGRGGLPQGPLDSATSLLWQDALPIEGSVQATPEVESEPVTDSNRATPPPIVEIQGWIKNEQGQIELVAEVPQQVAVGQPVACQG